MTEEREARSVAFDRVAEHYDATRVVGEEAVRAQTALLAGELRGRGRVLEVGVGTGQVSLPLHEAGLPMIGVDLSGPMLAKLLEKAGGRAPFPLARADGTRLPFADGAFGGVVMRWVLHLVPRWRDLVADVARAVGPGGVVLVNHGGFSGIGRVVRDRVQELVGRPLPSPGLSGEGWRQLRAEMRRHGAGHRELEPLIERSEEPIGDLLRGLEQNRYSWTWDLGERERLDAAAELRPWLERRYGPLDAPYAEETATVWHAYDLP